MPSSSRYCRARLGILVTHPERDEAGGGMPLVQPLQLRQLL